MAHLLDLSTLAPERPTVRIDGAVYAMALPTDFGLVEHARLQRLQAKAAALQALTDPSDEDVADLARVVDDLAALVLPGLPAEVRARLGDMQRLAIVQAFRAALGQAATPAPAAAAPRPTRSIGATRSRASSGSTARPGAAG